MVPTGPPSDEDDEEQEHDTPTLTEAAVNLSEAERRAERRAELQEYSVQAKVDRLMADIDARRGGK